MSLLTRMLVMVLTAAAGLVAATSLALAPAQSATPSIKLCVDDSYKTYCLTRTSYDTNFANDLYCYSPSTGYRTGDTCGVFSSVRNFEDKVSSFDNDTANWWKLYEDRQYGGYVLCVRPWGYDSDLGNNTPQEDDISSAKMFGTSKPTGCDQSVG